MVLKFASCDWVEREKSFPPCFLLLAAFSAVLLIVPTNGLILRVL
jgi:hypothetical protein